MLYAETVHFTHPVLVLPYPAIGHASCHKWGVFLTGLQEIEQCESLVEMCCCATLTLNIVGQQRVQSFAQGCLTVRRGTQESMCHSYMLCDVLKTLVCTHATARMLLHTCYCMFSPVLILLSPPFFAGFGRCEQEVNTGNTARRTEMAAKRRL